MAKEYIPLTTKIKDATVKLKNAGYVVINTNDETFAILAERKRILCNNCKEFFQATKELTENKN